MSTSIHTSIFVFRALDQCECGLPLDGCYVELNNDPPGSAREEMFRRRGPAWSHEVNGTYIEALGALVDADMAQNPDEIRRTHQRVPANPPGSEACFCGLLGTSYAVPHALGYTSHLISRMKMPVK